MLGGAADCVGGCTFGSDNHHTRTIRTAATTTGSACIQRGLPRDTDAAPTGGSGGGDWTPHHALQGSKRVARLCVLSTNFGAMTDGRLPHVVLAGLASAVVSFVAVFATVADPSGTGPLYVALLAWPVVVAVFAAVNVEVERLPRFAAVFCGSLVGLTLLFGAVVDYRLLGTALDGAPTPGVALAVNPVMAVLVGGALVLAYYGVFQCGRREDGGNDGRVV